MPLATTASARYAWDDRLVLALERHYLASVDTVWQAVIDVAWHDEPSRIEPVANGDVSLGTLGTGRVLGLVPRQLLVFTAGTDIYRWELTASEPGCTLTLNDVVCNPATLHARAARLQLALEALAVHLGDTTAQLPDYDDLVREHTASLHPA